MLNWIKNLTSKVESGDTTVPNTELSPDTIYFIEYHKNNHEQPIYLLFEGNENELKARFSHLNLKISKDLPAWVAPDLWKKLASNIYTFANISKVLK